MTKDQEIQRLWSSLIEAHAILTKRVAHRLKGRAPLSLDEYDVLRALQQAPRGRVRFSALAEATLYTRSGITRIVGRLERAGYLQRESCPEDARGSYAVITAKGIQSMRDTWSLYGGCVTELLGTVCTLDETRATASVLERLTEAHRSPDITTPLRRSRRE